MGTSVEGGPLNFFTIVKYVSYDLLIVFSSPFLIAPLEMVTLTTNTQIYLMIYLIDITNID